MHSTSTVLRLTLFSSIWLGVVFAGCSGPQRQQTDAIDAWALPQLPPTITASQLDSLLVHVSQLQMVSQESLDAAKSIGTPEPELAAAHQDYAAAEQLRDDGHAAYMAGQYALSWDRLRAADAAFRRAEEAAIRAGLSQLERELAANYDHLAPPDAGGGRHIAGAARVSQGSINLRDGAGTQFQILGKAHFGAILTILAESGEWYRVRTGTGLVGWVSKILVTRIQSP
jgi:Bacterial SH3 domain